MKPTMLGFAVAGLLATALPANAQSIVGQWTGTGLDNDGINEVLDLFFNTQTADASGFAISGMISIQCIASPDPKCGTPHGPLDFSGSLAADGALMLTVSGGTIDGQLSGSDNSITATLQDTSGFSAQWNLARTSVPEPTTLALPGLGLSSLAFSRRRRTA